MEKKYHAAYIASMFVILIVLGVVIYFTITTKNSPSVIDEKTLILSQRETPDSNDLISFYDASAKTNKLAKVSDLQSTINLGPSLTSINNIASIPANSILFTSSINSFDVWEIKDFGRNLLKSSIICSGGDMFYATGSNTFARVPTGNFGRSLLSTTSPSSMKTLLSLVPGVNVQAYSAGLKSIGDLNVTGGKMIYTTDTNTYSSVTVTDYVRNTLFAAADASDLTAALNGIQGPGSSTDNAIVRYNGTGGSTVQNSGVTIDDSDNLTVPGTVSVGGQTINTLRATNIANMGSTSISSGNWAKVATMDQHVATTSDPTFNSLTMVAGIAMATSKITGLGNPTSAQDAATKFYVDTATSGTNIGFFGPVRLATTSELTVTAATNTLTASSNGAITIDGVAGVLNDKVLVKNQTLLARNGFYTITTVGTVSTPFVLTRATGYTNAVDLGTTRHRCFVTEGTNGGTGWVSNACANIGTDDFIFTQIHDAPSAGNGLELASGQYNVKVQGGTGNIYINGSNKVDINGALAIAKGGTNSTSFTSGRSLYFNGTSIVSSSLNDTDLLTLSNTKTLTNKTLTDTTNTIYADYLYCKAGTTTTAVIINNAPVSGGVLTIAGMSPQRAEWTVPSIDIAGLTALSPSTPANADLLLIYDSSGNANRKVTFQNFISGITLNLPRGPESSPIIVASTGGDYTTLQAAFDYLTTNVMLAATVLVYPGTYEITSPLDNMPTFTQILGIGTVIITNTNNTGIFDFTSVDCNFSSLKNLSVYCDATGANNAVTIGTGVEIFLEDIIFLGNATSAGPTGSAISVTGKCTCKNISFEGGYIDTFVTVENSGELLFDGGKFNNGDSETIFNMVGTNITVKISNVCVNSGITTAGMDATDFILIDADANFQASSISCSGIINALRITGDGNEISLGNVNFADNTLDVFVDASGTSSFTNNISIEGVFERMDVPSDYGGTWQIIKRDSQANQVYGNMEVGNGFQNTVAGNSLMRNSSETYLGSGGPRTRFMKKFNTVGSTYTNVTSTFTMFSTLAVNNALYIGNEEPFYALDMELTTALVGDKIRVQYYGGSAWNNINTMSTQGETDTKCNLLSYVGRTILRLDYDTLNGSTPWETTSVDSSTKYWIRFIVNYSLLNAISVSPVVKYIKVIPTSLMIGEGGIISRFGTNEKVITLSPQFVAGTGDTQSITISPGIVLSLPNLFTDGGGEYHVYRINPHSDIDSSRPILFNIRYSCYGGTNSTILTMVALYSKLSDGFTGFTLSGAGSPSSEDSPYNTETVLTADDNKVRSMSISLDVSERTTFYPIYVKIMRGGLDAYDGNVAIIDVSYTYYSFR